MTPVPAPLPTRRADLLARLAQPQTCERAVIGGRATDLGVVLDAAARGFSVVLVDSHDFAKGTSSRTTKLVHGGVRYLAHEYACTVEDRLAHRSRLLFLDARKAIELAHAVAQSLRKELGTDPGLDAFLALAQRYLHIPAQLGA